MKHIVINKNRFPKRILISYANETYKEAQRLQTKTARIAGFSEVIEYTPQDIDEVFKKQNKEIFKYERGNGLWLWKPYLIKKTLDKMKEGEILFYCDAGACFFRNTRKIISTLNSQDIWVSALPLKEKQFTKKETFDLVNCTEKKYEETAQVSGTFCAFKKSDYSLKFVSEWLEKCCNIEALEPPKDRTKEDKNFFAHREDQSILSLLVKKYDIKVFSDPSQYGRLPEKYKRIGCEMLYYGDYVGQEDYPICIIHHRTKDGNRKVLFKQLMCAILPRRLGLRFIDNGR